MNPIGTFERLESRTLLSSDMVLAWNNVTIDAIRADRTLPGPTWSSRTLAMVHAAIFDAANGVDPLFQSYVVHGKAPHGASMDAAIATAAHDVLVSIYPLQQATIDSAYQQSLAQIPDGKSEKKGVEFGEHVADAVIKARRDDGSSASSTYTVDGLPGHWEPDPLNPDQTALGVNWGSVTPFAMTSGLQFRPPHPPAMTSDDYAAAFDDVKELGAINSATRTAEQTQTGFFWGYDRAAMGTPLVLYNQILQTIATQQHNSEIQNARLFFLANAAQADAGIAAWDCKFVENFWRPITAIRRAGEDGNLNTAADPTWTPLGAPNGVSIPGFTPPFPAYVSGHATFGAAAFKVLQQFYGTDQMSFSVQSDELPGVTRSFTSFTQAAQENGRSRIYLGIHWSFDDTNGEALGRDVANWAFSHLAQPLGPIHQSPAPKGGPAPSVFSSTRISDADPLDAVLDSPDQLAL